MEKLSENIYVDISKNHRFGSDAFLLADFSSPRKKDRVCDFGTGCGIIPLVMCKRFFPYSITGIDIQAEAIDLFKSSISASKVDTKLTPMLCDIRTLSTEMNMQFDLVTCNPPYKLANRGILSSSDSDKLARHETECTIDDVCNSAARLLNFGGRLCICQRPERLLDVLESMRRHKLEPKRVRFVAKDKDSAPWLFLVEAKKGSQPFLKVEPTFYMYENDEQSAQLNKIYGNEQEAE